MCIKEELLCRITSQIVRRIEYDVRIQAAIPQERFTVKKISLMKSERTDCRLTYTEIYAVSTTPVDR